MPYKRNVTYIQDLPDIEHFEQFKPEGLPQPRIKAIRNNRYTNPHDQMNKQRSGMNQLFKENFSQARNEYYNSPPEETEAPPLPLPPLPQTSDIHCLDICNHIKDCPLCSKFYDNDKTVYIIIIVMLCIINLIFLKKILNL